MRRAIPAVSRAGATVAVAFLCISGFTSTVRAQVNPPIIVGVMEDTQQTFILPGVIRTGGSFTIEKLLGQMHGSLSFSAIVGSPVSVTYTPHANYWGPDMFQFRFRNGVEEFSLPTDVRIDVMSVNDAPVAQPAAYQLSQGSTYYFGFGLFDIDSDTVSTTILNGPQHGVLTQIDTFLYSYTPEAGYSGSDSLRYYGTDDAGLQSQIATVSFDVTPVASPIPEPETYAMLLAGLGVLGFAARRRKLKEGASV